MKRIKAFIIAAAVGIGALAATATVAHAAQEPESITESITELAKPVLDAVLAGDWFIAAALALVLFVGLFTRYAPDRWTRHSAVKAGAVLVGAFGGALATTVAAGAPFAASTFWVAFKIAISAAGGYSMFKALVVPLLKKANDKMPKWLQPVLGLLLKIFESQDPEERAQAAGDKAVADNPSTGAAGVTGEPKDIS